VKRVSDAVGDDPSSHLFDPVNAFQLVNRYYNGWMTLHDSVYKDNAQGECSLPTQPHTSSALLYMCYHNCVIYNVLTRTTKLQLTTTLMSCNYDQKVIVFRL